MKLIMLFLFTLFLYNIVFAEDDYEVELHGSTIVDVCKWAERNTIMHFKINRNLEVYWNDLPQEKRLNIDIKNNYEAKKKSNLDALNINSKRYHYLNCFDHLYDK